MQDGILTLTLNRPEQMNSFTVEMANELVAAFNRASDDDAVRAIVVTGAGKAFCPAEELLHELRVHQIELEMQNETLRQNQLIMEESRDRYVDLYDFAPVGYLTLSDAGMIAEANLTGAALLGIERKKLLGRRLAQFISGQDRDSWHRHLSASLQQGGKQNCELAMLRADASVFHAQMDCLHITTASNSRMARITFSDVSQRKKLEDELKESRQLLRNLAKKTELLREEERKRIAREVHDELGQIHTALRMDVALINMRFGVDNTALLEKTQSMAVLLDQATRCVRNIVANLRPTALDMGIVSAIRWLCNEYAVHSGKPCVLHTTEQQVTLSEVRAVAVFRMAQELLTNAARHADASFVTITLTKRGDDLHVEVRDNGRGFDPALKESKQSYGLLGIRERVMALGGNVEIASAPDQGTVVTLIVPTTRKGEHK